MDALTPFMDLDIDWDMTPADAVALYLEWGNNDRRAGHPPVRSRTDVSRYFVLDAWESAPVIRLVQRTPEQVDELVSFPLPEELMPHFRDTYGPGRGLYAISGEIRAWLKKRMGQEGMRG